MINDLHIADFVPVSLIDYPGEISSLVFTYGCNLRCRYCHNPELVTSRKGANRLDDFLFHLRGKELDGVAVTGGEPLLSRGILPLLRLLKKESYLIKLDTNGFCPEKLAKAAGEGLLDMVSVDVKAFNEADLKYITRTDVSMKSLYRTMDILKESGIKSELRHTVWKVPDRADVDAFMGRADGITIQFPIVKGRWLDKTFKAAVGPEEKVQVKEIFDRFGARYRNE